MVVGKGDSTSTMTVALALEPPDHSGRASAGAGTSGALPGGAGTCSENSVNVDIAEVYFLVMHFLSIGPCQRAFAQLSNEVLQYKLLPRRYHAVFSRGGKQAVNENDDGMSFPLSYANILARNPTLQQDQLMKLLQQLLVQNRSLLGSLELPHSRIPTAADVPTLLGTGTFSLLDSERSQAPRDVPGLTRQLRWPHWHADQVHGLMLRQLGGGFARHKQAPSVRTPNSVIVKPAVLVDRIQIIKKLRGHRNAVYCAIFDGTGQYVITGSDDRLVKFWSAETGLCLRSCRGHEGDITDLAVSNRNKYVASASNDFSIRVWLLPSGVPVSVLRGHTASVTAIAFSPRQGCEHLLLSSSDDGTCRIWDASDSTLHSRVYMPNPKDLNPAPRPTAPAPPSTIPGCNQIFCCAFNADGSIFVTGSSDKIARVWDACKWNDDVTGMPNYEMDTLKGHENDVNYVQFSGCAAPRKPTPGDSLKEEHPPRFRNSWFSHDSIVTCSRDGTAIIWMLQFSKPHAKVGRWQKAYHLRVPPPPMPPQPPRGNGPRQRLLPTPRGVNMIVWSLDNRFVLAAIMDHRICVWNAVDGSLVHSLTGHDNQTYVLDVHPLNPRIAMSAGYDGRVIIWDIWEGRPIKVYETEEYNLVDGNFSPDGTSLVVSDEVGQIYIFGTGSKMSEKDVKYDQFFLGDFRPLVRDLHGNVLDVETQLPPHHRNLRDLLCDAGMIPYGEPYQTIYQQRRLANLGFEWQPPTMTLSVGTSDDVTYFPPDQPTAFQPPAAPSPERHDRQGPANGDGNRWVEQPPEVEEAMDWEQDVAGLSEDTGSDYSASEESLSEEKGGKEYESLSEGESNSEEDGLEATTRLRRSGRNKRKKAESGRPSSRRRVRGRTCNDYDSSKHRLARGRQSKASRNGVSRASRGNAVSGPEPASTRPQRQAARNALTLFSSFQTPAHDEDEEDSAEQQESPVPELRPPGHGERAPAAAAAEEPRPQLRPLQRLPQEEGMEDSDRGDNRNQASTSQPEPDNLGDCRRPRSQRPRKLVLKFRTPAGPSQGPPVQAGQTAETVVDGVQLTEPVGSADKAPLLVSTSEIAHSPEQVQKAFRKLIIKPPKPVGPGSGSTSRVLERCNDEEENFALPIDTKGSPVSNASMSRSAQEGAPLEENQQWQWKKGKAVKGAHGGSSSMCGETSRLSERPESSNLEAAYEPKLETHAMHPPQLPEPSNSAAEEHIPSHGIGSLHSECERELLEEGGSGEQHRTTGETGLFALRRCTNVESMKPKVEGSDHQYQGLEPEDHQPRDTAWQAMSTEDRSLQQSEAEGDHRTPGTPSGSKSEREDQFEQGVPGSTREVDGSGLSDVVNKEQIGLRHTHEGKAHLQSAGSSDQGTEGEPALEPSNAEVTGLFDDDEEMNNGCTTLERRQLLSEDLRQAAEVLTNVDEEVDMSRDYRSDDDGNGDGYDVGQEREEESLQKQVAEPDLDHDIDSDEEKRHSEGYEDTHTSVHSLNADALGESEDESIQVGRQSTWHKRQKSMDELASSHYGHPQQLDVVTEHSPAKRSTRHARTVLEESRIETQPWSSSDYAAAAQELPGTSRSALRGERQVGRNGKQQKSHKLHDMPWERESPSNNRASRVRQVFHSSEGSPRGSAMERPLRIVLKCPENMMKKLDNWPDGTVGGRGKQTRGSSRAAQGEERTQHHHLQKEKAKVLEVKVGVAHSTPRGGWRASKHSVRQIESASWLLMSEVEPGTHFTPQFADEVAYLQQGHKEFLEKSKLHERGPWKKHALRAVEFCRITGLEYHIEPDARSTSCKLQLEFTEPSSPSYGHTFRLTLPELTDYPDFLVERSRYDASMTRGWGPRDHCKVWWASEDGEDSKGQWWDGRIKSVKLKSDSVPGSPWEKYLVTYKESSEPTAHSPWELFDKHCQIPGWTVPRIEEYLKEDLLEVIYGVEETSYDDVEDEFGVKQLRTLIAHNHNFLNKVPVPLTLEKIRERLEKDYYHSDEAVEHDIRLLVLNAEVFAGADSELATKMNRLAAVLLAPLQ